MDCHDVEFYYMYLLASLFATHVSFIIALSFIIAFFLDWNLAKFRVAQSYNRRIKKKIIIMIWLWNFIVHGGNETKQKYEKKNWERYMKRSLFIVIILIDGILFCCRTQSTFQAKM